MEEFVKRGPGRPRKYSEQAPDGSRRVRLLRGYWPLNGGNHPPKASISLPIDEARNIVENGIAVWDDAV